MTDNSQEIEEILDTLAEKSADSDSRLGYVDAYVFAQEAKQAILDWHNKQIINELREAKHSSDTGWYATYRIAELEKELLNDN